MLQEMGREPTPEELAERHQEDRIRKVLKSPKSQSPWKRRSVMMKIRIWGDFIEDTTLELPLDSATTESLRAATRRAGWPDRA